MKLGDLIFGHNDTGVQIVGEIVKATESELVIAVSNGSFDQVFTVRNDAPRGDYNAKIEWFKQQKEANT